MIKKGDEAKNYTRIEPTDIIQVGDRFKRDVVIKRYKTDDGLEHEFTTFNAEGRQAVAVIAVTPDNQVVVSRQFRAGRERYVDEIPGGAVELGEDLREAVQRELLEEVGYKVGEMTYLGKYSWDAYSNLVSHYFFATGCYQGDERTFEQLEQDQGLETGLISIDQLINNATHDNMTDTTAVLMAYDYLRDIQASQEG